MTEKVDIFDSLIVVKRSGQRTHFQGEKIALAIKKAFDSIDSSYKEEDVNKVYALVLKQIEKDYSDRKTIQIEDIQDLIELTLQKKGYHDVFLSFQNYREQRSASRKAFVTKQQHKFLKSIEALGFNDKEERIYQNEKSPNELLTKYGITIASGFAKAYLLETKTIRALDSGLIAISHLESIPLGGIESIELDLGRIFKEGVLLSDASVVPLDSIETYLDAVTILIKSIANSVYGQIQISNFDYDTSPFILATYKACLKEELLSLLTYSGLDNFINMERLEKEVDKLSSVEEELTSLTQLFEKAEFFQLGIKKAATLANQKTVKRTELALCQFLQNLNSIYDKIATFPKVCLGLGTDTKKEGQLLISTLLSLEKRYHFKEPSYVFKLQKGKSWSPKDKNYALCLDYLSLSLKTEKYVFANLEMKTNKQLYQNNNNTSEVCYFHDGGRSVDDSTTQDTRVTGGKGNLFTCSINLPRIILKLLKEDTLQEKSFFQALDQSMDMAKDALLSCFDILSSKHNYHFPLLLGQNIWQDGKTLKDSDRLRKVLKHGTLSIHFVGLDEILFALTKEKRNTACSEKLANKVLRHMKERVDNYCSLYNLNFTLSAKELEDVGNHFNRIDTAIYGKVKGVTDTDAYHNGFESTLTNWHDVLLLEKDYHSYTNGGHKSRFLLSKRDEEKIDEIFEAVKKEELGSFIFQRKS